MFQSVKYKAFPLDLIKLRIVGGWYCEVAEQGQLVFGELELMRAPVVVMGSLKIADRFADGRLENCR